MCSPSAVKVASTSSHKMRRLQRVRTGGLLSLLMTHVVGMAAVASGLNDTVD